jgi:undecaprenyl-diphosphatase
MNFVDAIILGLVQGLTEFIPISSSGHLILARDILGLYGENALAIDAVLQLATALAILIYFAKDFPSLIKDRKFVFIIILATIPAVVAGLLLESRMETIFRSSSLVASMLILGAVIMYLAEKFGKQDREVGYKNGFMIGLFQSLALVPGMSRSGATISGGLIAGLTRESAARFSFLLALPIILGSGLKKLFDLSNAGALTELGWPLALGCLVAFLSGLWAIHFLINYLKGHKLTIFIWYRVVLAGIIFLLL